MFSTCSKWFNFPHNPVEVIAYPASRILLLTSAGCSWRQCVVFKGRFWFCFLCLFTRNYTIQLNIYIYILYILYIYIYILKNPFRIWLSPSFLFWCLFDVFNTLYCLFNDLSPLYYCFRIFLISANQFAVLFALSVANVCNTLRAFFCSHSIC